MSDIISKIALPVSVNKEIDEMAELLNLKKPMMLRLIVLNALGHQELVHKALNEISEARKVKSS